MIREYLDEALRRAHYEKLDDGSYYAEVPALQGVLANAETLEACREQLAEVIEEWRWGAGEEDAILAFGGEDPRAGRERCA